MSVRQEFEGRYKAHIKAKYAPGTYYLGYHLGRYHKDHPKEGEYINPETRQAWLWFTQGFTTRN